MFTISRQLAGLDSTHVEDRDVSLGPTQNLFHPSAGASYIVVSPFRITGSGLGRWHKLKI